MKTDFGTLPNGQKAQLYTITNGKIIAKITDFGATLVSLIVPDKAGLPVDVNLGYDDVSGYATLGGHLGATVGRNANRIGNASFYIGDKLVQLGANDKKNNLHSGPNCYDYRLWKLISHQNNKISFGIDSPDGDQGFPGNAKIQVTYCVENNGLKITYDGICDQDTVFNMTNHSYFNLAGHNHPELAMEQTLMMPATFFNVSDNESIPTGELRPVAGTPMDFTAPKAIGRDIEMDYEPLHLQFGYDHNFEVRCNPCAVLHSDATGITMQVHTDCPGIQFYSGNYLNNPGKDSVFYTRRGGIALETQFYPNSVNHPEWPQPFVKANTPYHSETFYQFV